MKNANLIYQIAKMYYLDNITQTQIADKLNMSKPKVSRLLNKAKEEGIVQITLINNNESEFALLEENLKELLNINNVLVVESVSSEERDNISNISEAVARYFSSFIENGDTIGISWGYTLSELSKKLPTLNLQKSNVVQISGNLDNADETNFAHNIINEFSSKLGVASHSTLPCPILVENPIIVDLLYHDSKISALIDQVNSVDIAFVNIGLPNQNNCLARASYINEDDIERLRKSNAVGCICSRFIDIDGNIADEQLDERTISINLSILKKAKISCVSICEKNKIPALVGAIKAKIVNTIAVDSSTAQALVEYLQVNIGETET